MDIFSTTLLFKAFATLLVGVLPVSIKTNAGETIDGDLIRFGSDQIQVRVSGETLALPFDELDSLGPILVKTGTGPTFRVTLVGGSRIAAQDLSLSASELTIEPRRQESLRVPVKQVKAVRFRAANVNLDAKWLGIVGSQGRGDTLVIRRGDDRLDPQSGIIEGIVDRKVVFDLEGDKINAPIEKLEGIVFGGTAPISENARIRVRDIYGSHWLVGEIESCESDRSMLMRLSDSLTHSIPLEQIESIHWSGGLVLLATQQPASSTIEPFIRTKLDPKLIEKFFSAHAGGAADLVVNGGSVIEYRIDPGYRTLAGIVHRDKSVRNGSKLSVQITLDETTVWEQELVDAAPRGFELPVGDARRLAIGVINGDDGDLGDTVRIIRPRLTK